MTRFDELLHAAVRELHEWLESHGYDTDDEGDVIFEIADQAVPIWHSDIMEIAAEEESLWNIESEIGPAFDGSLTLVNIAAALIFDAIEDALWTEWEKLKALHDSEVESEEE